MSKIKIDMKKSQYKELREGIIYQIDDMVIMTRKTLDSRFKLREQ